MRERRLYSERVNAEQGQKSWYRGILLRSFFISTSGGRQDGRERVTRSSRSRGGGAIICGPLQHCVQCATARRTTFLSCASTTRDPLWQCSGHCHCRCIADWIGSRKTTTAGTPFLLWTNIPVVSLAFWRTKRSRSTVFGSGTREPPVAKLLGCDSRSFRLGWSLVAEECFCGGVLEGTGRWGMMDWKKLADVLSTRGANAGDWSRVDANFGTVDDYAVIRLCWVNVLLEVIRGSGACKRRTVTQKSIRSSNAYNISCLFK